MFCSMFIVELLKAFEKNFQKILYYWFKYKNTTWSKHLCQEMEELDLSLV